MISFAPCVAGFEGSRDNRLRGYSFRTRDRSYQQLHVSGANHTKPLVPRLPYPSMFCLASELMQPSGHRESVLDQKSIGLESEGVVEPAGHEGKKFSRTPPTSRN